MHDHTKTPLSESAPSSSESAGLAKSYRHANQIMIKASDQTTLWITYTKEQKFKLKL